MKKLLMSVLLLSMPAMASERESHGSQEPSPRAQDNIVALLLAKGGPDVVRQFAKLVTARDPGIFTKGKTVKISANCRYIGDSQRTDRDEMCFVIIDHAHFRFVYSGLARQVSDVELVQ